MRQTLIDLQGQTFGWLTVVGRAPSRNGQTHWACRCRCGRAVEVYGGSLRKGKTTSCGCRKAGACAAAATGHGESRRKRPTPEYRAWHNMIQRCHNPKGRDAKLYGGRGIAVCRKWIESFESFLEHVGRRPTRRHSLDRFPDTNGNYEPGNVRWATAAEQSRNKRTTRNISFGGRTMCLTDWAKEVGVAKETMRGRIERWGIQKALTTPGRRSSKTGAALERATGMIDRLERQLEAKTER